MTQRNDFPTTKSDKDNATSAVTEIIDVLTDRRGLRHAWDNIDADIQVEIAQCWERIVLEAMSVCIHCGKPVAEPVHSICEYNHKINRWNKWYAQQDAPEPDNGD